MIYHIYIIKTGPVVTCFSALLCFCRSAASSCCVSRAVCRLRARSVSAWFSRWLSDRPSRRASSCSCRDTEKTWVHRGTAC